MPLTSEQAARWAPIIFTAATALLAIGGGWAGFQAQAENLREAEEQIEENAEDINVIQQTLIRRQGEIGLDVERLRIEQNTLNDKIDEQSEQLDDIIQLLRQRN